MATIKGHVIKPSIDLSDVQKGFDKINDMWSKLDKVKAATSKQANSNEVSRRKGEITRTQILKKQNELQRKIAKAEKLGLDVTKAKRIQQSNNYKALDKTVAILDKNILSQEDLNRKAQKQTNIINDQVKFFKQQEEVKGKTRKADSDDSMKFYEQEAKMMASKQNQIDKDLAARNRTNAKIEKEESKRLADAESAKIKGLNNYFSHLQSERKAQIAQEDALAKLEDRRNQKNIAAQSKLNQVIASREKRILDFQNLISRKMISAERAGVSSSSPEMMDMRAKHSQAGTLLSQVTGTGFTMGAIGQLDKDFNELTRSSKYAQQNLHSVSKELGRQSFLAQAAGDSIRNLARSYVSAFAVMAGAVGAYRVGEELGQVKASMMASAGGDMAQLEQDWSYVKENALALGSDLTTSAKGYQSISIAAKQMGMSLEQSRYVFMASQEAAAAFNLSVDDASGVTRAFSQMLSKGKVSSEELNLSRLAA